MTKKRIAIGLLVLIALAAAGAAAAWYWNERETRDLRGSSTQEFVTTEQTTTRAKEEIRTEPWPIYGLICQRTRDAVDFPHEPPFDEVWVTEAKKLVEFPPVIAYGPLYMAVSPGSSVLSTPSRERSFGRRSWVLSRRRHRPWGMESSTSGF